MTQLRAVLLAPPGTQPKLLRWHHVWLAFALTGLGFCVGVLTLMLAATAYLKLDSTDLFLSYFLLEPMLLLLNVLPPILLIWFFYFLTRRAWAAFLGSFLPCVGLALVNVISEAVCLLLVLAIQIFGKIKDYIKEKYSFTNRVFEEYYPIEEGSMEKMSQNLEGLCDEWELDFKQSFFIHLIVEELLLNIMKFGIGKTDKKYYVSVKVMDNNGECILRIRDNVNSYNPFDLRGDEVDRAVMEMIKKKAKYYEYQRKLVFNYLYVKI